MLTLHSYCHECGQQIVINVRPIALDKPKRGPEGMIQRVDLYGTLVEGCEHSQIEDDTLTVRVDGETWRIKTGEQK